MTTTNKPMTGEQLDELMTVSVNMQRESEKLGDRSAAMFAYAVQVAVLELRSVRNVVEQLAAENAALKSVDAWMKADQIGGEAADKAIEAGLTPDEATRAGIQAVIESIKTPSTDAILAEVRASGVEMFGKWLRDSADIFDKNSRHDWADQNRVHADKAAEFAAKIRQEAK